jgi:hypothetical protein
VVMFAWKEPTPSDKLRPIKKLEAPAAGGGEYGGPGSGRGGSGPGPASPPPSPPPSDSGGSGRPKVDDLIGP